MIKPVQKQNIKVTQVKEDRCEIEVDGKFYGTFWSADIEMAMECGQHGLFALYRDKDNRSNRAVLRSDGNKLTRVSPFM